MSALQAVVIALVQGLTELFPVSSLGHAVVLPALLEWRLDEASRFFLPFLVMLHVGTATALLAYFWQDWIMVARAVLGLTDAHYRREGRRVFLLIVVATIPAVIVGFTLEKFFRHLFGTPVVAAIFLVVNGGVLLAGERLRQRSSRSLATLNWRDALIIGLWQCLALIPGISRSGATMLGGLTRGVDHEGAAHFSFLIATPVIAGAAVLEVPKLLHRSGGIGADAFGIAILGAIVAGLAAFASTAFLMRYFRHHDRWALDPFAYYCIGAGAAAALVFAFR